LAPAEGAEEGSAVLQARQLMAQRRLVIEGTRAMALRALGARDQVPGAHECVAKAHFFDSWNLLEWSRDGKALAVALNT
jgi:hypothetical protein